MAKARKLLETVVLVGLTAFVAWRWLIGVNLSHAPARLPASLRLADGAAWRLFEPPSRFTILDFGASWCAPCRWEEPLIASFARHRPGARLKFVDEQESPATTAAFAAEFDLGTPVLDDGSLATALSVWKYPTVVIVRSDGSVAATFIGYDPAIEVALLRFAR